jgi:glutamate dehydrogenase (NAD(P)+)
MRDNG